MSVRPLAALILSAAIHSTLVVVLAVTATEAWQASAPEPALLVEVEFEPEPPPPDPILEVIEAIEMQAPASLAQTWDAAKAPATRQINAPHRSRPLSDATVSRQPLAASPASLPERSQSALADATPQPAAEQSLAYRQTARQSFPSPTIPSVEDGQPVAQAESVQGPTTEHPEHAANRPDIQYPLSAYFRGQEGRVVVAVHVNQGGAVSGIWIAKSSGVASLDSAALSAVRGWRFRAGKDCVVSVPVNFAIREG